MMKYLNTKKGWKEVGGKKCFFKSDWEYHYSLYLQYLKSESKIQDWFYEPKIFRFEGIKSGVVSYLPDFKIIYSDTEHEYVEVKGYWDARSKTKVRRFAKYYPNEKLIIVDAKFFKQSRILIDYLLKNIV
jgi:predicted nuclease of restriction endonuclease-like RecB superfamily